METKGHPEEIDLQSYWLALKRHSRIATGVFIICAGFAAVSVFMQRTAYQASGQLLIQSDKTPSLTGVGEKLGHLESIMREANPLSTQALILESAPLVEEVIKKLNLRDEKGGYLSPKDIDITAEPVIGADVLKVSYSSENPKLAEAVVNQVMESYIANNILSNRSEAIAAGTFIEKQIPRARAELDRATEALRLFKAKNKVINLQEETSGTVKTLITLDDQLNDAHAQLADISAQEQAVKRQINLPDEKAVGITSLSQVRGVQELLAEMQMVQTRIAALNARFTKSHPAMITLKEQEALLQSLLQQRASQSLGYPTNIPSNQLQLGEIKQHWASELVRLQSQRLGLEKKVQSLSQLREHYKQRANTLPHLEKKQGELERRLSVAQKSYENLLLRLQEIKVAESQTVGNARVLEYAKAASNPKALRRKLVTLVGGGLGGLLLGVAAAFAADLIDRRVKTTKEAESLFGYTLLGLIPYFDTKKLSIQPSLEGVSPRVIVTSSKRTMIHEAYQMLQANLKFISLDKKVRVIVVTSAMAGEGKSEISANLAAITAQSGRRVLLVDADMRQPSQHHLWGSTNSVGLTNVLVGQVEFSKAVQLVTPYLSVLTVGLLPPNPAALIDSERMTSWIDAIAQMYDCIIFDTPPLVGIADAAMLGKMADGVLVVVRPGVVGSTSVVAAKSLLARSEANVLGIVANSVNLKREPNNYFYYDQPRLEHSYGQKDTVKVNRNL